MFGLQRSLSLSHYRTTYGRLLPRGGSDKPSVFTRMRVAIGTSLTRRTRAASSFLSRLGTPPQAQGFIAGYLFARERWLTSGEVPPLSSYGAHTSSGKETEEAGASGRTQADCAGSGNG